MNSFETTITELFGKEVRHCTAPFSPVQASAFTELETLPYGELKGPGFERLCYEILLSKGYEPRFFGRSGQSQPEIDLVAIKGEKTEVFSCKNLAEPISFDKLKARLAAFKEKWLHQTELPKPDRFVICWPQPFRDSPIDKEWNKERKRFHQRTGIQADIWHLDIFNGWLKKLPDIVADLFSDRHAKNFCDPDINWNADLFIPLREGASGDPRLKRYIEYRRVGKLYLYPDYERDITEALENFNVILLRGLPGTGKSFAALAVAEGFRNGRCRSYFLDVGHGEFNITQLKEGIRRRLSRPSLFLLENCHLNPDAIEQALQDLEPELKKGRGKIICLARRVPGTGYGLVP